MAGRMQKPNATYRTNNEFDTAIDLNRKNALILSLFLLDKDNHDLESLFVNLCNLSYMGDPRTIIGIEQKDKVRNIARSSFEELKEIYRVYNLYTTLGDGSNKIDFDYQHILELLPTTPIWPKFFKNGEFLTKEKSLFYLALLKKFIIFKKSTQNFKSSTLQGIKQKLYGWEKASEYSNEKKEKARIKTLQN